MNVLWAIIWLILLLLIGWPIGFFCAGWYVCCLPFEVCIDPLKQLNELLHKGVKLPWEMAQRLKEGRSGW